MVNTELNIVACTSCSKPFIRGSVIAPSVFLLSVVIFLFQFFHALSRANYLQYVINYFYIQRLTATDRLTWRWQAVTYGHRITWTENAGSQIIVLSLLKSGKADVISKMLYGPPTWRWFTRAADYSNVYEHLYGVCSIQLTIRRCLNWLPNARSTTFL